MKQTFYSTLLALFLSFGAFAQNDSCEVIIANLTTGQFGNEVSWNIIDVNGNFFYQGLNDYQSSSLSTEVMCLPVGCYMIEMFDSFGDGWNGAVLSLELNGEVISTATLPAGEFGYINFEIMMDGACQVDSLIWGCTDPMALNYNPAAIINDGTCEFEVDTIYGCTDPAALNYWSWATADDGSCVYPLDCDSGSILTNMYVCVFGNGADVGFEVVSDSGEIIYSQNGYGDMAIENFEVCLDEGVCYTAIMTNNNPNSDGGWYGGYFWANVNGTQVVTEFLDDGSYTETVDFSADGTCGPIFGCTDPLADNYNPDATNDNGSCSYTAVNDLCADALPLVEGVTAINNSEAWQNENIWGDCWNWGGGEGEQTSLWYTFTTPDYPAYISIETMGDGSFTLTDTQLGLFESCGGEMVSCDGNSGEGMFAMMDFNCGDLAENTTYIVIVDGWNGDAGSCLLSYSVSDMCDEVVLGCTDQFALNYNPLANLDDGSCIYETDSCDQTLVGLTLVTGQFGYEISFEVLDENGNVIASVGGLESNATYYYTVCVAPGCYTVNMNDSWGDGWNGATLDITVDGVTIISGLTLPAGVNGTASVGVYTDDCEGWAIEGCTDPAALNYNPLANVDDGSCFYDVDTTFCQASFEYFDVDIDNDVVFLLNTSIGDDLNYSWDFGDGTGSQEEFPNHTYNQDGTYLICLEVWNSVCESYYCDTITYINPPVNGSGSGADGFTINVIAEGANGLEDLGLSDSDVNLYPNPTSDQLNVVLDIDDVEGLTYQIVDLSGRTILANRVAGPVTEINLASLSEGSYVLMIMSNQGQLTKRFNVFR